MSMMEIKSKLTTRERIVFALLWMAFFAVLAWLALRSPASLASIAWFLGGCAIVSLLLNREVAPRWRLAAFILPLCLLAAGFAETAGQAGPRVAMWALIVVAACGGFAALVSISLGLTIYRAWMHAAAPIGWFISHVVLGAVFFLVFTPIGLIMRLLGRDALRLKFDRAAKSYWIERRQAGAPIRYLRQS